MTAPNVALFCSIREAQLQFKLLLSTPNDILMVPAYVIKLAKDNDNNP